MLFSMLSRRLLALTILSLTFSMAACETPVETDPETNQPVIKIFDGSVWVPGSDPQHVVFNVPVSGTEQGIFSGTVSIGNDTSSSKDSGSFTVDTRTSGMFQISGTTKDNATTTPREVLRLALKVTSAAIIGATPTNSEALTWDVTRTTDSSGTELFDGKIVATPEIPLWLDISMSGLVDGGIVYGEKLVTITGQIQANLLDPTLPAELQSGTMAALLIATALHTQK